MEKQNDKKAYITIWAPILVLVVLLLFEICKVLLNAYFKDDPNIYIVATIMQVIVFILPSALYFQLRGRKFAEPLNIQLPRFKYISAFLCFVVLYIITITLVKFVMYYLTDGSYTQTTGNDIISIVSPNSDIDPIFAFVAFIVVPTVCEELFFRGVVLSEYQSYGNLNAIFISALFFSMFHFSAVNFLSYFTCGLLFGALTVVTRSVFPAMLLHMLNNVLSMYTTDSFLKMMIRESGVFFVGFFLVVILLLVLVLTLGRIEHIYLTYSQDPPTETIPASSSNHFTSLFVSPSLWLLVGVFILVSFIN